MHMAWDLSAIQAGVLRYFTGMRHSSHPLPEACMPIWTWSGRVIWLCCIPAHIARATLILMSGDMHPDCLSRSSLQLLC